METKWSDEFDGQHRTLYRIACSYCSVDVWIPKYAIGRRKYCSMVCFRKGSQNRVTVTCDNCKTVFLRCPSNLNTKTGKHFCSNKCKDSAQRLDSGIDYGLPHYKNGSYRRRALREHGSQCNRCGYSEYPGMLDVHHVDRDRSNNTLDNLEVLCVWCHIMETRGVPCHVWQGNLEEHLEK